MMMMMMTCMPCITTILIGAAAHVRMVQEAKSRLGSIADNVNAESKSGPAEDTENNDVCSNSVFTGALRSVIRSRVAKSGVNTASS
jgi:hypothetical protein